MLLNKLLGKNKSINIKFILIEIILVTIGVLMAIAVNNWNTNRLIKIEVDNYLLEIQSEIQGGIKYQNRNIERFESMSNNLLRVMKIIERNDLDSIPYLNKLIWPIGTTWPISYELPILEEFMDKDYLNTIENDSLKKTLKMYNRIKESAIGMAAFNEKQYLDKVESFINKNIEYLEIMESEIWETNNINNHPRIKTNFKELFNDLEFWNILTLKTETFFIELSHVKSHKRTFLLIEKYLNQYLDNN
jgi:hypothetical protein